MKFIPLLRSKGGAFNPKKISGLRLWLRADTAVFIDAAGTIPVANDGDAVGCWKDQSGNGYDVSQATTSKKPALAAASINGHNTIHFDAIDDLLVRTVANWLSTDTAGTVYFAIRIHTLKTAETILSSQDEGSAQGSYVLFEPYASSSNKQMHYSQRSNSDVIEDSFGSTINAINTIYIMGFFSDDAAISMRRNSLNETVAVPANGHWFGDTVNRDNFSLGAMKYSSEAGFYNGELAEIIVYSTKLTANQVSLLENYLNARYAAF